MPADPIRIRDLFLDAVELTPDRRAAFLDAGCGADPELRAEVERLLAAHADPASILEPPPSGATGTFGPNENRPVSDGTATFGASWATADHTQQPDEGTVLGGKYKLVEVIGEGGMGTVWMARQTEPVKRVVAVKLIKAGMDSKAVLARFDAERQALAMMDHPNIAKVLDAGASPDGRPYFVMELVKGVPITRFCDERRLTPRQRLELFVPVCNAIQHAHQKGIIHRDIKPNNVLIALYDDRAVPKVIDFGIAKAAGQSLTDQSLLTGFGAVVGTPEYMSPEQASLNNLDIDTRSDVYSLGALLYELLTGSTPVDRKSLGKAALLEVLRIVREVEAPRPSARLSTIDTLASVAASRGTEPAKLSKLMKGELDWVLLKALEKDRARRYETANGLARDVQRYLADEIVEARPPSRSYRLKKLVRRHKGQVIAAGLVFLSLVTGVVGTTWGLLRARDEATAKGNALHNEEWQRGLAEANARQANEQTGKALAAAAAEKQATAREAIARGKAETAYEKAAEVLDLMVSGVTGDSLATQKAISAAQKTFLTHVLTYYREFASAKADDQKARARTARAAIQVGTIEYRLGHNEEGVAAFQSARGAYAALAADFPSVPAYRNMLASSHNNLGILLADLGKDAEAEEQYKEAIAVFENLVADFPSVPAYRSDLAKSYFNLGNRLTVLGKGPQAEEQYKKNLAIVEKLVADFPAVPAYRSALALSHNNRGDRLADLDKGEEAEEQYKKAIAVFEKLTTDFPSVPAYRSNLALSHNNLGLLLADLGKRPEAEVQYRQGLALREKLAADFPAVSTYQLDLGASYCNVGNLVLTGGRVNDSLVWFGKAIAALTAVHTAEPQQVMAKRFLRNSYNGRAMAYDQLRKYADGVKDWDKVVELSPAIEQAKFRASRVASRLNAGMVGEAVAEVADLTKSPNWGPDAWYFFASVYAVASTKLADQKREYADRAMELVRRAVKAGYTDVAHMKSDPDLDPLRDRADFRALVADLGKRFPPPPELAPPPRAKK